MRYRSRIVCLALLDTAIQIQFLLKFIESNLIYALNTIFVDEYFVLLKNQVKNTWFLLSEN